MEPRYKYLEEQFAELIRLRNTIAIAESVQKDDCTSIDSRQNIRSSMNKSSQVGFFFAF